MKAEVNNPKTTISSKEEIERVSDLIDDMLTRKLAKGDDEYYEMAKSYRKGEDSNKEVAKPKRKRGRGI